jgi:hypothetical protein
LLFALAAAAGVFCARAVSAQELPGLENFLSALPAQTDVPSVSGPSRVSASPLSGEALFSYLHDNTAITVPAKATAYLAAKKYMFSVADNAGCGGGPGVTCLYSQVCAKGTSEHGEDYKEVGDQNGDDFVDSDGMNAEHSWPQSFFNQALPMRADLHHIFPTFMKPNNSRGSEPFAMVSRPDYATNSGSKLGSEGFEPANAAKGDIARAILYFVVRYYDVNIRDGVSYKDFWTSRVPMFLDWDRQDPPDAAEKRRNDFIAKFQGNRNPFVDDVTLAGRVGLKVFQAH